MTLLPRDVVDKIKAAAADAPAGNVHVYLHPGPIPCGSCSTPDAPVLLSPVADKLDQTGEPMPAWSHRCLCGWSRTVRAK